MLFSGISGLETKGRIDGVEFLRPLEDGSFQDLLISSRAITLDGEGCAISTLVDITDRKRIEDALRKSEARYREIFNSVENGLLVIDFNGVVVDANSSASNLYGFEQEELMGMAAASLVTEKYRDLLSMYLRELPKTGRFFGKAVGVRKDGGLLDTELRCSLVHMKRGAHMLVVVRDVTERKRAEAALRKLENQLNQAQKMEAIGTLSSGIAHDFNNILSGIMGYAELAKEKLQAGEKRISRYLAGILEASGRAGDLVRQILAFSRRGERELSPMEVCPVVQEALKLLRVTLPGNIEIMEELSKGKEMVKGDAGQIHQVVMNLCTNGYHAMRETGGELFVRLEKETLKEEKRFDNRMLPPGTYVKLVVRDTGVGMDSETADRIFDTYFTTREVGVGTGLGLFRDPKDRETPWRCRFCAQSPGRGGGVHRSSPLTGGRGVCGGKTLR